jgi:hypothetical protein
VKRFTDAKKLVPPDAAADQNASRLFAVRQVGLPSNYGKIGNNINANLCAFCANR